MHIWGKWDNAYLGQKILLCEHEMLHSESNTGVYIGNSKGINCVQIGTKSVTGDHYIQQKSINKNFIMFHKIS